MTDRHDVATTNGRGRQRLVLGLTLLAAIVGTVAIVIAVVSQRSAPTPSPSAAGTVNSRALPSAHSPSRHRASGMSAQAGHRDPPPVDASVPTSIDIPSIGVHSAVIKVGKAADGTLAVPQPGPNLNKAAWYEYSVTPGQDGPSVIEGHIDSDAGPSVFYQLGAVKPGDMIRVTRADQSVATFTVNAVRAYATHNEFPTVSVFGSQLNRSTLRLITCSNFDTSIGHYVGNTVVFAHLTAFHAS